MEEISKRKTRLRETGKQYDRNRTRKKPERIDLATKEFSCKEMQGGDSRTAVWQAGELATLLPYLVQASENLDHWVVGAVDSSPQAEVQSVLEPTRGMLLMRE